MKVLRKLKGFNLIELLTVVAIIALLFTFAITTYQRYLVRTQVSRVVLESGNLKIVIETCLNNGEFIIGKASDDECDTNAIPSNIIDGNSQGDIPDKPNNGVPIATITEATNTATIVATFGNSAYPTITGDFIRWNRDPFGAWSCESTAPDKYNDPSCL